MQSLSQYLVAINTNFSRKSYALSHSNLILWLLIVIVATPETSRWTEEEMDVAKNGKCFKNIVWEDFYFQQNSWSFPGGYGVYIPTQNVQT